MPTLSAFPDAVALSSNLIARFKRLAELHGYRQIMPHDLRYIIQDLGYRTTHWSLGDGIHWLASHLATAGRHPSMPNVGCYSNGFSVPGSLTPECVAASLNKLLPSSR